MTTWLGSETLADLVPDPSTGYFCNGDTMFHVNKGAIAYKIDGASRVRLENTSARGIRNLGAQGTPLCDDYQSSRSHPLATLNGYGGAVTRAYSFAGSSDVRLSDARISDISAAEGDAIGVDTFTDTRKVEILRVRADGIYGGADQDSYFPPNGTPQALGFHIGPDATRVKIVRSSASDLVAPAGGENVSDETADAEIIQLCRR